MSRLGRPPVMLDIIEEHFEEFDFLWELREGIIFAPDWNLEELAEHEERAEAHLDGLRLAELHAVDIARPALSGSETFAATAATFVFMETGESEFQNEVVKALEEAATDEARDGIRIGLRHSDIAPVAEALQHLAGVEDLPLRAAVADVFAFHRHPAPEGVHELLGAEDLNVRRLAFGALARWGGPFEARQLNEALDSGDAKLQRAALEAFARAGFPGLAELCRAAAVRPDHPAPEALAFLGVLGDSNDFGTLQAALENPDLATAAIQGLGALGNVAAIPLLIDAMANKDLAHGAGAAFQRITGAENIQAEKPPPPSVDEPDLEGEFADDTPGPDPERARAWWEANVGRFPPEGRWQAGREVSNAAATPVLHQLPLETRRDLYLEARARAEGVTAELELEARALMNHLAG